MEKSLAAIDLQQKIDGQKYVEISSFDNKKLRNKYCQPV